MLLLALLELLIELKGSDGVPGVDPGSAMCKASPLSAILKLPIETIFRLLQMELFSYFPFALCLFACILGYT